jgi:hypothetical protein
MQVEPDGHFEVFVGGEPREVNWMRGGPGANTVFVRQTSNDWATEQASPMLIERIDRSGDGAFPRPDPDAVQALFEEAGRSLTNQVGFLAEFMPQWAERLLENELPRPQVGPPNSGYFPGQFNVGCRFAIGADEALVVTIEPAAGLYQSVSLGNPFWANSIHPRTVQSTLNAGQATVSSDGLCRYVISVEDPGVHNWLDTCGQHNGLLFVRYQRVPAGTQPAQPRCTVVKLAAVRARFPDDEPVTDAPARERARRARRLSIDRRFA